MIWLKKQFLHHIDYACLRDFNLRILMCYEISPKCFYLTKNGLIRKPNKPELKTELKSMITKNIPTQLLPANHRDANHYRFHGAYSFSIIRADNTQGTLELYLNYLLRIIIEKKKREL